MVGDAKKMSMEGGWDLDDVPAPTDDDWLDAEPEIGEPDYASLDWFGDYEPDKGRTHNHD